MQENKRENVVEVVGLVKTFNDFWGRPKANAIKGIDFTIGKGDIFGLLGPNGSGKSTTIKVLLGLLYPTKGGVRVFGEKPTDFKVKHRIGYLPEESYLYNYLTARETLHYFGSLFNLSDEECSKRTEQLLEMVGLQHVGNRPVGEFSKGMARRIGLAQALINDPELVILDEPTAGLDPIGCREIKDLIRVLASRGKTVVLCSHLLSDVEDVCTNAVIMYGGTIKATGDLETMLQDEDTTQIEINSLKDEDKVDLQQWLNSHGYDKNSQISKSKNRLEDYFLKVVSKAKNNSDETSGAQQGGAVATYLQDAENKQKDNQVNEKLQNLINSQNYEEKTAATPKEEPVVKVNYGALEKLNNSSEEIVNEKTLEEKQIEVDEKRNEANKKLTEMLRSK